MKSFFRYISYIDYLENGVRLQTAGFLRWKLQNGQHKIEMQIKDIPKVRGSFSITETETGITIDSIFFDNGIGNYEGCFLAYIKNGQHYIQAGQKEINLGSLKEFKINLENGRLLKIPAELPVERKNVTEYENADIKTIDKEQTESLHVYKTKDKETVIIKDNSTEIEAASENVLIDGIEEKYEIRIEDKKKNAADDDPEILLKKKNKDSDAEENEVMIIEPILYENKWQQLCASYPVVHPFMSGREFLSIKPEDFIILQQGYQQLVHNSFLLHGFYNYQHMILGRLSDDREAPYYVGVPGVYYDREKQAAQMFGFAGFESTEIPVQNGSFGYYMIEVEI